MTEAQPKKKRSRKTPTKKQLERIRKRDEILDLKEMSGLSIRAISAHLAAKGWKGVSPASVHALLAEGLDDLIKNQRLKIEQMRQLESNKIDRAETQIFTKLLKSEDADAIEKLQRALDRLWKRRDALFGLHRPEKVEVSGVDGAPIDTTIRVILPEIREKAENLMDQDRGDE